MKIYKTNFLGRPLVIKIVKRIPPSFKTKNAVGFCSHDKKEMSIWLKEGLEGNLLHELVHLVGFEYNLNLSENKTISIEQALLELFLNEDLKFLLDEFVFNLKN